MAGVLISIRDVETALIARANKDEAFAKRLKSDPKGALQEELAKKAAGMKLPADLQVKVVEETPNLFYIVLPPKSKSAGGELTPAQLEMVSGGGYRDVFTTCCMVTDTAGEKNYCG